MIKTFNCGVGGILIVKPEDEKEILQLVGSSDASVIGRVTTKTDDQVVVTNFSQVMEIPMRSLVPQVIAKLATPKKKVGVLISGSGTNLQALIDATQDPTRQIGADIVLVVSNKTDVEGLRRAERAGIPTKILNHKDFASRVEFDMEVHKALASAGVDIVCLAGFMRILSKEFVQKWKGKLINVHPALLPLFKGTHAQKQALEAGVRLSGCSVHFVEADVDAGAIITQEAVVIELNDTEESLTERIKTAEHRAFPRALQLLAGDKVKLGNDGKLVWSL